jgi:hypothetical protein
MLEAVPWWICLLPAFRVLATGIFVMLASLLEGRATGHYPTLIESCEAFRGLLWVGQYDRAESIEREPACRPEDEDESMAA